MSTERFYRNYHKGRFVGFKVAFQQTDLWIGVDSYKTSMENCCLELVKSLYHQLMHHIERQPEFLKSLEPIEISEGPNIVRAMVDASKLANVGPMAAVAGAVADQMGNMLVESFNCDEVIVENGGDLFIKVCNPVNIGIYAGSSPLSGNEGLFGLFYGVPSSSSSTPTSSSSTDNSGPINTFGLLPAVFSFNSRDEQLSCGPDHLEVCNREACDELGEGYWWYGGSCCSGQQIETYDNGRIAEAPVRLGEDADNGIISAGEGMSILLDVPGNVRTYAVLTFPNGDYFFIDNNDLITKSVVPVTSGELPVSDNLCAALEELPEFKGEWEVVFLTVPSTVEEFQTLNDIVDYMNNGGTYHLGNYSVMLDCQARSNNPLSIFGVFQ